MLVAEDGLSSTQETIRARHLDLMRMFYPNIPSIPYYPEVGTQ